MKNAIKKVVAVAMAFTLLGTGTTIAKTVNPKSVTTLSAHAACKNHVVDSSAKTNDGWTDEETLITGLFGSKGKTCYSKPIKCVRCGKILWYRNKVDYWKKNKNGNRVPYKEEIFTSSNNIGYLDLHNPFMDPIV